MKSGLPWERPDPREGVSSPAEAEEETIDMEKARQFWSFQPISDPEPPVVKDKGWPRGAIDRFVLAKLEEKEIKPAPEAGREALLRRVTIALTGLPPTLEEQDAYLADSSDEAFEKVVDRLLASRAFAERWGRHWLDLCRYSDTSGGGRAMPLPDAWRFRDYVIDSFDRDKPLDQVIREHIAGDLLPSKNQEQKNDQLTATGFLVLGPHNYENQDKELLDLEIVDEQLDTIGRAFLGMTIGCARCHDHKFDPIPTRDYYGMAGIFLSTKSVVHSNVSKWTTRALAADPVLAAAFDEFTKKDEALDLKLQANKKQISRLSPASAEGAAKPDELAGIVVDDAEAEFTGYWKESTVVKSWVGKSYRSDDKKERGKKRVTYRPVIEKAGRYEVRVSYNSGSSRSRVVPVIVQHAGGESVTKINQRRKPSHAGLFETVGVFEFEKGETTIAITNEGTTDGYVIIDAVQLIPEGETGTAAPAGDGPRLAALKEERAKLEADRKKLAKTKPVLPTAMSVLEGEKPADTEIRIRGMARKFGEKVPRGFLEVVDTGARPGPIAAAGSGRLELADWITSPHNPLTARVLANRIWLHLFGEGLVASPDNFGLSGQAPTHPELLDFLARRLVANDWSTKKTIREIVLSRTWQMSSEEGDPRGAKVDPENTLHWKAHRPRIDAEAFRDSILLISGQLDPGGGGPSLPKGFKSEFGHKFKTKKRSVYIPVFRNQMHEIFTTFDFANPNFVVGKRSRNAVPTQSLFLMNSPFIHEAAAATAGQVVASKVRDDRERMIRAYRAVLGRAPRDSELALSLEFLRAESAHTGDEAAWAAVIRGLFSCVDFQYIH